MRGFKRHFVGAAVVGLFLALGSTTAFADSMTWRFRLEYPNAVRMQLFSDNRNWRWPSMNRHYILDSFEGQNIEITCRRFEKICYGAWEYNSNGGIRYWGVGPNRRYGCTDCCFTCDGGRTTELVIGN